VHLTLFMMRSWLHSNYPTLQLITVVPASSPILWLFCVGWPPGRMHCRWKLPACVLVVATNTPNRSLCSTAWTLCTYVIAHQNVGGMTDGSFRLHVFVTKTIWYSKLVLMGMMKCMLNPKCKQIHILYMICTRLLR